MMLSRLRRSVADVHFGQFAVELFVLILGILIAFQIDRWAEDRRDRKQEYSYLLRLKEDLQIEIQAMDNATRYADARLASVLLLEEAIANPSIVADRYANLPVALEKATWRSFPQINAFVYTELQSSGNLALIESVELRRALANYYSSFRNSALVAQNLNLQNQFDRLTAGILTTAELTSIEDGSWSDDSKNISVEISVERAARILEALKDRQDAVDLLPSIAQQHVFNKKVIQSGRTQALSIIEQIDGLLADFGN